MKKLALNLLKSADEKLRGISKQPQGTKTTSVDPSGLEIEPPEMAERRIQLRQGRRDNFRGNESSRGQQEIQQEKTELKRRSRSEGPQRRIRQRDDKRVHQSDSFAKGDNVARPAWAVEETSTATRVSRHSPPISDDGGFNNFIRSMGSDSDSYDSDEKQWTKNPLVTRRTRRSGGNSDKRRSNGGHISSRDSFIYYSTAGQDKSDSSGTGGSFKGNKYQKLEERRKKRIDMQMTSDEENSPEHRISRLRQRAIQSGLGRQPRIENTQPSVPNVLTSRNIQNNNSYNQSNSSSGYPSNVNNSINNTSNYGNSQANQNLPRNSQGNYGPQVSSGYQHFVSQRQYQSPSSKVQSSYNNNNQQHSDPVPFGSPQTARVMTYGKLMNNNTTGKPYTGPNLSDSGHQPNNYQGSNYASNKNSQSKPSDSFSPVKSNRFVYNSSPEVGRKFDLSAARGSSIDSVYDTGVAPEPAARGPLRRYNQHVATSGFQTGLSADGNQKPVYVNPPSNQTMELQRGSVVKYPPNSAQQASRASRINEPVELRFDANKISDGPLSPVHAKQLRHYNRVHSDDSLDELVLSNVQYLDKDSARGKVTKSQISVSRSASLPDQKRSGMIQNRARAGSGEIVVPYPVTQVHRPTVQAAPFRQRIEKTELEIRVPMPVTNRPTPEITIADENRFDQMDYSFAPSKQERKLSYDSRSGYSRPASQYFEREEISKSDSQLNTNTIPPSNYRGEMLHPMTNYNHPKSLSADQLLPPGQMGLVHSRPTEAGMFSDVDYDIEVSDRIRKWESFMKKSNEPFSNGNGLTTIQEKSEQDFGLTPHDPRRAPVHDVPRPIATYNWSSVESVKTSDPTIHIDPQIISHETNTHRLFQLVPGVRVQATTNSMSTLYQTPLSGRNQNTNEHGSLPALNYTMEPFPSNRLEGKHVDIMGRRSSFDDSSTESPIQSDKGSRYLRYQELHDIKDSKDESVRDLCRMFNFNEGGEGRQVAKISPQKKTSDDEWAKIISDMEDNIKKADVWSPHMESTKGESLSIERVKARTLQTIPFQDDPFWKEIEEMTSFESLVGQKEGDRLSSYDDQFIVRSNQNLNQSESSSSQSTTLPNQPRLSTSSKDRLQRSKSLYTPNIAPLTLGMPPRSHNSQTTLEDALDDLKTSVDRSSTRESLDSRSSSQTQSLSDFKVSAPVRSSMYIENVQMRDQPKRSWNQHRGSGVYDIPEDISVKDMYTFSTEPGQTFPNVVNGNYALDPNLLKHKLLSTGLVEDSGDPFYLTPDESADVSDYGRQNQPKQYQGTMSASTSKPVANTAPQRRYQSEEKVNQVSQSMEDLRQLAKNVENKIELIKTKLVQADDNNLDKILLALRKFAPSAEPKSPEIRSESMHDFYQSKHSKLTDALLELERIYKNLDLENESLLDRAERRDYPSYRRQSPAQLNISPPKREMTSLSIQLTPPVFHDKADIEKQTQSEFDAISKSFQAILDEVNQTSAVTTSSEEMWISGPQSVPDSPRLPMRVTLKSTQIPSPTAVSPNPSVSNASDNDSLRQRKSRHRFRSKQPDVFGDDVAVRKARSKSSPRIESTSVTAPSPTSADYLNPREMSAAKGRIRIRPEKEPDVMHDDMAYRNLIQKEPQEVVSNAKSTIQIELSSPESPQVKSELKFERTLVVESQSKVSQPPTIQSASAVKHEPKIMGGVQQLGNQSRQVRSLQLGKASSLPTKLKPKEIVTATKKEIVVIDPQNKSDRTDPVPINTVALVKIPSTSHIDSTSSQHSQNSVQPAKVLPNEQVTVENNVPSVDGQKDQKTEIKINSLSQTQDKNVNSQVTVNPKESSENVATAQVNVKQQPAKTNGNKAPVLKLATTKNQPPKLDSSKLAKFAGSEVEKTNVKSTAPNVQLKSCRDTKLKVYPKSQTTKILPKTGSVKTEVTLIKGDKSKTVKLPEKEIIIQLPTTSASSIAPSSSATPTLSNTSATKTVANISEPKDVAPAKKPQVTTVETATSTTNSPKKQRPEKLPIPEKKTVETQTVNKSKLKQSDRRVKSRKGNNRGLTAMADMFSSSDEDRLRKSRPLLTRSAPDLSVLSLGDDDDDDQIDDDHIDDPTSRGTQAEITEDNTDFDESDGVFLDDSSHASSAPKSPMSASVNSTCNTVTVDIAKDTKPPAHPLPPKHAATQDGDKSRQTGENRDSASVKPCANIDKSVQLRRRHSLERTVIDDTDQNERPKSFHELLASFETNKNKKRLLKMRSLRKCLSEDAMASETFVSKIYRSDSFLSEPDLSETSEKIPTKEGRQTYPTRDGELFGFSSIGDRYNSYGKDYTSGLRNFDLHSTQYSRDYVTDSMSRYSSRTYDSGLGSRRYDSTSSRPYTSGSSYSSGSYGSSSRSFDSGRYGSSSGTTSRYGGSSYTSDLSSSSRYGTSGIGSSKYSTTSGSTSSSYRTSIPLKSDDISGRRGSRRGSSDLSLDTDLYDGSSRRRSSLRNGSDKSDILSTTGRRPSYKDEASTTTSTVSSYTSRRDKASVDSDGDKYKSARTSSLRDSSSVESNKDVEYPRSQYRNYSNGKDASSYKSTSMDKASSFKSTSLDKTSSLDKKDDVSTYSSRRAARRQREEEAKNASKPSDSATTLTSYQRRRDLDKLATESTDSDASMTRRSAKKVEEEAEPYESFAQRRQRRKESIESLKSDSGPEKELGGDRTRWRSFASDAIKEAETPKDFSTKTNSKSESMRDTAVLETKEVECLPVKTNTSDPTSFPLKDRKTETITKSEPAAKDTEASKTERSERIAKYKEERRRQLHNMGKRVESSDSNSESHTRASARQKTPEAVLESKEVVVTKIVEKNEINAGVESESQKKSDKETLDSNRAKAKEMIEKTSLSSTSVINEGIKTDHSSPAISLEEKTVISQPVEIKPLTISLEAQEIKRPTNLPQSRTSSTTETKSVNSKTVKPAEKPSSSDKTQRTPTVEKAKSPSRSTQEVQNKQKIAQDTSTTRTRIRQTNVPTSRAVTKTAPKTTEAPLSTKTTNVRTRTETGKQTRSPTVVKKTEDGLKVSRKTVSERFAKTQIHSRKPSSGMNSSDDEEPKNERPHPPKSPAARRAKLDSSKTSSTSSTKRKAHDAQKSSSLLKPSSPNGEQTPSREKADSVVQPSPANLDDLLKKNKDYLSDNSTIQTPSPRGTGSIVSGNGLLAVNKDAPVKRLFKNGVSKEEHAANENNKGDNSDLTIVSKNDSDEEFSTAPSTPQVQRPDRSAGQMTNDYQNQRSSGLESQTTKHGRQPTETKSTTLNLLPTFNAPPMSAVQTSLKIKQTPSHEKVVAKANFGNESINRPTKRGKDFSRLLEKFSSSELSSSESDFNVGRGGITARSRRAPSASISSSDESNTDRQTPERTQSFKLRTVREKDESVPVKRSSSFKSSFMSRNAESDKPSEELASVLQTRSHITDQQAVPAAKYENLDRVKVQETPVEETIVDKELSAVLRSRRKETDSKVEQSLSSGIENQTKIDSFEPDNIGQSKSRLYKIDSSLAELSRVTEELDKPESTISKGYMSSETELGPISHEQRRSSDASLSDAVKYIKDIETSISTRISESLSKSLTNIHQSDLNEKSRSHSVETMKHEPRSLQILDSKYDRLALTQTLEVRNVTLDESTTDDITSSVTTPVPAVKSSEHSVSKRSINDTKLHDLEVSSTPHASASKNRSENDTSRHLHATGQRSKELTTGSKSSRSEANARNGSSNDVYLPSHPTDSASSTGTNLGAVIKTICAEESVNVYSSTAKSSPATNNLPANSNALDTEGYKRLNTTSTSKYLDVSESTILTSSDRSGIEFSETSTDETSGSRRSKPITRSESLKVHGVKRTESFEKRKGILKRTPSLPKQATSPIVDAQLAQILEQRRMRVESDSKDEEEEQKRPRRLSVSDEIQEVMKREKENKGSEEDEDDEQSKLSVSERIFRMQTKIEEEKYAATPKSRSGFATPKSPFRTRSGAVTPKKQMSFEGFSQDIDDLFSGEKLMEKLTNLAEDGKIETIMERRRKLEQSHERRKEFQKKDRDDWRRRTQPITIEEISEADNLDSVTSFRALVRKKALTSVFEQLEEKPAKLPLNKKSEFPEHLKPQKKRRSREERYQTLPVTAAELMCIPENEMMESDTLRSKVMSRGRQDSKADSGILSGSDVENASTASDSLRSLSLEMDCGEDDPSRSSVNSKTSFFKQMEEKSYKERHKGSASGAKRYIDRKKRERYLTQPITEEEVKSAAEQKTVNVPAPEVVNRTKVEDTEESAVEKEDELTKLSLKDKVRLFASKKEEQEKPPPLKQDSPVPRRRNRKHTSRFSTQPVTSEEVEKAAKISPLHMSLVKPPDPEILKGLPLKAQRELVACHAEACLSQCNSRSNSRPNSRPGSQPGSRRASFTEEDPLTLVKGADHAKSEGDLQKSPGILRKTDMRQSSPDLEVRGILKGEREKKDQEPRGILKRAETIETSKPSEETRSILKHGEEASTSPESYRRQRGSRETESEPRTIPQREDSDKTEVERTTTRGILKKDSSFETKKIEPERGVLKKLDSKSEESSVKGILKKDLSSDEDIRGKDNGFVSTEVQDSSSSSSKRRSRQADRYLTQPAEVTPEKSPQTKRRIKYEGRHYTQPVTPDEMKEAEQSTPVIMKGGSVADRLNALKKSGEEEWKKRVPKSLDFDSPQDIKLRDKKGLTDARPVSLADRLNLLDVNKTTWRDRVEEKDNTQFTVAGKISQTVGTVASPLVSRIKNRGSSASLDLGSKETSPVTSPVTTPTSEKIPLPKDIISHASSSSSSSSTATTIVKNITKTEETITKSHVEAVTVTLPQFSSVEVDSFFETQVENVQKIDIDIDDMDDIFLNSNDILPAVRKIRPAKRRPASSLNPLKNISVEVKTEYTEISTGVAERELKRVKVEKIAKDNSGFAQEALAGLASKENFSKVALRKTDVTSTPGSKDRLDPFKDVMLLHVKGRRNIQTRLVQPSALSINSGDCYILITPEKIVNWIGKYSNVIEKAKAADITNFIHQKKDLGCKGSMATVDEEKQRLGAGKHFWAALGGQEEYQGVGPDEEDEIYENYINKTNMVFKLENNSLLPFEEYWGAPLKYSMLDPEMTLVFDFGAELYLWLGKKVSPEDRKIGRILSQQLWEKGYDYSACDINPLCPLHTEETSSVPVKSKERPDWALFGKLHQGMETILFKEKFTDWPDSARIIKVKGQETDSPEKKVAEVVELQPYDASKMVPLNTSPVDLVLEGSHVGRGTKWLEDMQGFMREFEILTLGVNVWHVMEYDHFKLPESSYGQFHDGDTYVVRWQYMISNAGLKSLKGQAARHSVTGRERCAYFFWQGKQSTINEKGASALMTVELDEERGPQVRVIQGKEPPCFLNLFNGNMIIHIGKREEEESNTQGPWRLYCVRNELENELCMVEISLCLDNLRSRSSFILLNVNTGMLYIWHGCKSPPHTRKGARVAADNLKQKRPLEVGLHADASILITEMEEGEEKKQIWAALESRDRSLYMSLLDNPRCFEHTVRLFHMTSVSGVFQVTELLNPARCDDLHTPFPFLQSDLYKVSQPALFLVDNHHEVYLWQGWWPEGSQEEENVHTGSAHARFNIDRRCALETTIEYCKASRKRMPKMYIVCAGVEPQQFTNIFPYWSVDDEARDLNLKDGKTEGYLESAEEILAKLKKTRYTLAELQERPLPEGVDASRLEAYLDDEEFDGLLHMSKEEFYALPSWKQRQLKQPVGLF